MLSLFLTSPTLPEGKTISINIADKAALEVIKKNPILIKEGVEYKSVVRRHSSPRPSVVVGAYPHSLSPPASSVYLTESDL